MKKLPNKTGLTVMEIMIAIVILGVLAAMGVSSFTKTVRQQEIYEMQALLNAIYMAEKAYLVDNNAYWPAGNSTYNLHQPSHYPAFNNALKVNLVPSKTHDIAIRTFTGPPRFTIMARRKGTSTITHSLSDHHAPY